MVAQPRRRRDPLLPPPLARCRGCILVLTSSRKCWSGISPQKTWCFCSFTCRYSFLLRGWQEPLAFSWTFLHVYVHVHVHHVVVLFVAAVAAGSTCDLTTLRFWDVTFLGHHWQLSCDFHWARPRSTVSWTSNRRANSSLRQKELSSSLMAGKWPFGMA